MRLINEFLHTQNETRELFQIPPAELDPLLSQFFIGVRQRDGSEYEPASLRGMLGSFERVLRSKTYGHSLISSPLFHKSKAALRSKQKNLKQQGLGNRPKTADRISDAEISSLYDAGQLGCSTPESIINTMWFNNTLYFGM